jgi:hypothetical protein
MATLGRSTAWRCDRGHKKEHLQRTCLEVLDQTARQLERGEASTPKTIDTLFVEELTLRENRRVRIALRMAKLSTFKTLAGFDFSFQPLLDKNRTFALAAALPRPYKRGSKKPYSIPWSGRN